MVMRKYQKLFQLMIKKSNIIGTSEKNYWGTGLKKVIFKKI